MSDGLLTKQLSKDDWHLIRVAINDVINQLGSEVYSTTCPATGANSDAELRALLKSVITRMSEKPQCHKCASKDNLRKFSFAFIREQMFICGDCFNTYMKR